MFNFISEFVELLARVVLGLFLVLLLRESLHKLHILVLVIPESLVLYLGDHFVEQVKREVDEPTH